MRQWLVVAFTHGESARDRPAAFAERHVISSAVLLETLDRTMEEVVAVLPRISERDLLATYRIQGYSVPGLDAIYQVVEHFGMHYGQMVYITKLFRGTDLGFYKELDRTGRPEANGG